MSAVLDRALDEPLARPAQRASLSSEDPLRIAAATLARAADGEITSTPATRGLVDRIVHFFLAHR